MEPAPSTEPTPSTGPATPPQGSGLGTDIKLYFTAPLRWDSRDWAWFGGALLAIGAAHHYDTQVRTHFVQNLKPGQTINSDDVQDVLPTVAVLGLTWAYATLVDDSNGRRDRHAYLNEQMARQQRGEPVDVDWVRAELGRVRQEQRQKLQSSQRQLRWLVAGMAVLFCVLWIGGNLASHQNPRLAVPAVMIATLTAWSIYRRKR